MPSLNIIWCLCSTLLAHNAAWPLTLYITLVFTWYTAIVCTWYACAWVSFMSFWTNVHQYNVSADCIVSGLLLNVSADSMISHLLLLLPPPQIGLMKDTLFVDMFHWDCKKVNEEEMRTNKCSHHAVSWRVNDFWHQHCKKIIHFHATSESNVRFVHISNSQFFTLPS